jgi:hypothetical protein
MLEYFRNGAVELVQLVTRVRTRHTGLVRDRAKFRLANCVHESEQTRAGVTASRHVMNITVREALQTRGQEAESVILKDLKQMQQKEVWTPVSRGRCDQIKHISVGKGPSHW